LTRPSQEKDAIAVLVGTTLPFLNSDMVPATPAPTVNPVAESKPFQHMAYIPAWEMVKLPEDPDGVIPPVL
jgi:hypothetical protein